MYRNMNKFYLKILTMRHENASIPGFVLRQRIEKQLPHVTYLDRCAKEIILLDLQKIPEKFPRT